MRVCARELPAEAGAAPMRTHEAMALPSSKLCNLLSSPRSEVRSGILRTTFALYPSRCLPHGNSAARCWIAVFPTLLGSAAAVSATTEHRPRKRAARHRLDLSQTSAHVSAVRPCPDVSGIAAQSIAYDYLCTPNTNDSPSPLRQTNLPYLR